MKKDDVKKKSYSFKQNPSAAEYINIRVRKDYLGNKLINCRRLVNAIKYHFAMHKLLKLQLHKCSEKSLCSLHI